jgi:drug/metabolite transporter (DMT)-like permease
VPAAVKVSVTERSQIRSVGPYTCLGLTLLIWSSAFPGIRAIHGVFGTASIALARFLLSSVCLAVAASVTRTRLPRGRTLLTAVLLGILGTAYHLCLNGGLQTVGGGAASVLVNTSPVFAVLLACGVLREPVSARIGFGLGLCLVGAVVIAMGEGRSFQIGVGAVYLVGAAVSWAVATVLQKPALAHASPAAMAAVSVWVGSLGLLPWLPTLLREVQRAAPTHNAMLVWLGIGPMGLATVTWAAALRDLPVSRVTISTYLLPVLGMLQSWWWLAEPIRPVTLLGSAVTISGVALVQLGREAGRPGFRTEEASPSGEPAAKTD